MGNKGIRFDDTTEQAIEQDAARLGISFSDWVRAACAAKLGPRPNRYGRQLPPSKVTDVVQKRPQPFAERAPQVRRHALNCTCLTCRPRDGTKTAKIKK